MTQPASSPWAAFRDDLLDDGIAPDQSGKLVQVRRRPSFLADTMAITNPSALNRAFHALADGVNQNVIVSCHGDSLTSGTGSTGGANDDVNGETYGYVGRLRTLLNNRIGTQGGGWIGALDARNTVSGSLTSLIGYGIPSTSSYQTSRSFNSADDSLTFTLPRCTSFQIMDWQDTASGYNGTFTYTVDGGAPVTVSGVGGNLNYRLTNVSGLSDTTHTVVINWVSGIFAICGLHYKSATGISLLRMGIGGWTSADYIWSAGTAAQQSRVRRAHYNVFQPDLAIIMLGHNDCSQQATKGTTPEVYAANLQVMINKINENTKPASILLVSQPVSESVQSPFNYPDYWPAAKALAGGANSNVAHIQIADIWGRTHAEGNALGLYADFVHPTNKGYASIASTIASALS